MIGGKRITAMMRRGNRGQICVIELMETIGKSSAGELAASSNKLVDEVLSQGIGLANRFKNDFPDRVDRSLRKDYREQF